MVQGDRDTYSYRRKKVDPIAFEVIRHRLLAITDEQAAALASVSGSPLVNEATDFNTGLFRAGGEVVTMGKTVTFHAASLGQMARHIIADCGKEPGIRPGDMFIVNHPYKGALHAPDFGILAPIFWKNRRIGWTGVCAHQLDVGGMTPGGFASHAHDVYQEGMLVPPLKLVEAGKVRSDVWSMIIGMSRLPTNLSLDLKGMIAANSVGTRRLMQTIDQYGIDVVLSVMDAAMDLSERKVRKRLSALPDGVFRAQTFLDHDGMDNKLYRINVTLTKKNDELTFDYTGSDAQAPGFVNATRTGLLAGVYAGLLPILGHDIPWNEGMFRPVKVLSRSGSVVDAAFPAPVSSGPLGAMWLIEVTATEVLSKLFACDRAHIAEAQAAPSSAPDLFNTSGLNQYGEPAASVFLDQAMPGGGAYQHRDGLNAQGNRNITAGKIPNVESMEMLMPVLYLYRKFICDTAGPGRNRGGASAGAGYILHDGKKLRAMVACHGWESPSSRGLFGGLPSSCNHRLLLKDSNVREIVASGVMPSGAQAVTGRKVEMAAKPPMFDFLPDDFYEWSPHAGGGWGDPLERAPERVAADVNAGLVSIDAARKLYGVVMVDSERADPGATAKLRADLRAARRAFPVERKVSAPPGDSIPTGVTFGDVGEYVIKGGKAYLQCGCGHLLSAAGDNWKYYCGRRALTADEIGPRVRLHAELEAISYACPGCARQLDIEVKLKSDEPLFDIEIHAAALRPQPTRIRPKRETVRTQKRELADVFLD
jgi:N-methylhydantoinase B